MKKATPDEAVLADLLLLHRQDRDGICACGARVPRHALFQARHLAQVIVGRGYSCTNAENRDNVAGKQAVILDDDTFWMIFCDERRINAAIDGT